MIQPPRSSRAIAFGLMLFLSIACFSLVTRRPGLSNMIPDLDAARQRVMAQVPPIPHLLQPDHDPVLSPKPEDASQVPFGGEYRSNATMLMLARNSDLMGVIQSVREAEDRFNRNYHYPWVFLNEEEFTDEFKIRVANLVSGDVYFGTIPSEHWFQPDWIDEDRARRGRDQLVAEDVIYGGSVSYRNMCRFNSGFFYHHELLQQFKWYWRVEPDVHFYCDVPLDPFVYMEENDKKYAFTLTMLEFGKTIPTLWETTVDFVAQNPQYLSESNSLDYLSDDGGLTYNRCHFWSNFEIADLDFWRGDAYSAYFEHLDRAGGFYYERWGDAPVHSIAAALFLPKEQIHFFREIGYFHFPNIHCPAEYDIWRAGHCSCNPGESFDYTGDSCMRQWERANPLAK